MSLCFNISSSQAENHIQQHWQLWDDCAVSRNIVQTQQIKFALRFDLMHIKEPNPLIRKLNHAFLVGIVNSSFSELVCLVHICCSFLNIYIYIYIYIYILILTCNSLLGVFIVVGPLLLHRRRNQSYIKPWDLSNFEEREMRATVILAASMRDSEIRSKSIKLKFQNTTNKTPWTGSTRSRAPSKPNKRNVSTSQFGNA